MRYEQITEGVEYGDLSGLVDSKVSIAEFKPKTGTEEDVIVIGFYVKDEEPAKDLAKFIERGVTPILGKVTLCTFRRPYTNGFISKPYRQAVFVGSRIHRHGSDAHFSACANHA